MKYILNKNIALRSFMGIPFAYYVKGQQFAKGIDEEKFSALLLCDGENDIEESDIIKELLKDKFIVIANEGEELTEWQKLKICDNRYMPLMNIEITERCNYNCLHCFNAVDAKPLKNEFSYEEINKLLNEAKDCGVNGVLITGGEPMIHKNFMDIIKSIYNHEMYVFEINTNGYFLTQKVLDEFDIIGCHPLMKISFDGFGFHDFIRGKKGAEEDALRAIKLCIDNDFDVMVQMQLNKFNIDTIIKTLDYLDKIGVEKTRIIRTVETPRFRKIANDKTFEWKEYYDKVLNITKEYLKNEHNMQLNFWETLVVYPKEKNYFITAGQCTEYSDTLPYCKGTRGMIAISASGKVYPCMQISGCFNENDMILENVKEVGLKSILQNSKFLDMVCSTIEKRYEKNEKCRKCKYWKICIGGCPALALIYNNDYDGIDSSKCIFFENGYYEKYVDFFKSFVI